MDPSWVYNWILVDELQGRDAPTPRQLYAYYAKAARVMRMIVGLVHGYLGKNAVQTWGTKWVNLYPPEV